MFKYLLKVSRPRFWIYLVGPYWIGSIIAYQGDPISMYANPIFWFWFMYFLIPANFLVYGVNDLADTDTDALNEKKDSYEVRFDKSKMKIFVSLFLVSSLPFLFLRPNQNSLLSLLAFFFFGVFYSLPPVRAKAKPLIDSIFNLLYVMPGLFGYFAFAVEPALNWAFVIAAIFWSMAMHTFSAIPDIEADTKVNLKTTAVWLGARGSLIYCGALFLTSALVPAILFSKVFLVLAIPYLFIILKLWSNPSASATFKYYKYFPIINLIVGFTIFWVVTLKLYNF